MVINNEKQASAVLDALNAVKNKVGLSRLAMEYRDYSIRGWHRWNGPYIDSGRAKLQVFWNYEKNEFQRNPKYGSTIWIADLNTNRYKKESWFEAIKSSNFNLSLLTKELGNYLYSEVNKYKDKLLLLHSNGGLLNVQNTNINNCIPESKEYFGYVEPKNISYRGWFYLLLSETGGFDLGDYKSITTHDKYYKKFKHELNASLFNSFNESISYIKTIERMINDNLYAFQRYDFESYLYDQLISKYGFEKVLEYEINCNYHNVFSAYDPLIALKKCISRLEEYQHKQFKITSSSIKECIINVINSNLNSLTPDIIVYLINRCNDLFKDHVFIAYDHNKTSFSYSKFNDFMNELTDRESIYNIAYLGNPHIESNGFNIPINMKILDKIIEYNSEIMGWYDPSEFKVEIYFSEYLIDLMKLQNKYSNVITSSKISFMEKYKVNTPTSIFENEEFPLLMPKEDFEKLIQK